jgi:predicted GNAT family acetyltransferase
MVAEIQHDGQQGGGVFYIPASSGENSGRVGQLSYQWRGDTLVILHVSVSPALRGEGVAGTLVERAVGHAEERGAKVLPLCSYARWRMEQDAERYAAVRA